MYRVGEYYHTGTAHHIPAEDMVEDMIKQYSGRTWRYSTYPPQTPNVRENCKK